MRKKKILVIDDEKDFTHIIKLNLEKTGRYQVETENDGASGFASAQEFKPDLILLDIVMPKVDGNDTCYQLKNNPQTKGIPIVFLSALVTKEEAEERKNGQWEYLSKPATMEEIIDCIERNTEYK